MIYVALLRGINVGGNNPVDMKKLRTTFESLGYENVVIYINSGNIVFVSDIEDQDLLIGAIEEGIRRDFRLDIKVLVRSFENIDAISRELPATWVKNATMRTDVMFLWEEFDRPAVLEEIRRNPVDNVKYVPGALLWNVEGKNYSKSAMTKLMGTKLYRNMTIRNVNTFWKIHEIMSDIRE